MKKYSIYFTIIAYLAVGSSGNDAEERKKEKTSLKLYYNPLSPSSRSVMILLKILGLPHESQIINLFEREHLTADYLTMNPQHTIPVLVDDGFVIVDSHAINAYLVNKYGTNDSMYPKEPKTRSLVDHKLHFDTGFLSQFITNIVRDHNFLRKIDGITAEMVNTLEGMYAVVEEFLKRSKFIAGDEWTIADISMMTSLSSLEVIWPPNVNDFPALTLYMQICAERIPHFAEINEPGVEEWKKATLRSFNFTLPSQTRE